MHEEKVRSGAGKWIAQAVRACVLLILLYFREGKKSGVIDAAISSLTEASMECASVNM